MTTTTGLVPQLDPDTLRFPDEFAPPSVEADRDAAALSALAAAGSAGEAAAAVLEALGHAADAEESADESAGSATSSDGYRNLSALAAEAAAASKAAADAVLAAVQAVADSIAADRGVPNGLATLDASGKLPSTMLPTSALEYKGTWDAATNTPALADGTGDQGDMYRVTTPGTVDLGSGPIEFAVGDYAIHNGTAWEKADTTDAVTSVAGKVGAVVLVKGDVGLGNVDNTSDADKPISTAMQEALDQGIVTAQRVDNSIILIKQNGGQVDLGSFKGDKGDPGDLLPVSTVAAATGAMTMNTTIPRTFRWGLAGNITIGALANPPADQSFSITLILNQDAAGGRTVTWPPNVRWPWNLKPIVPTGPSMRSEYNFSWDGAAWHGVVVGDGFA